MRTRLAEHQQSSAEVPANVDALDIRQLAHELNSLLDGSLRCLGLAQGSVETLQSQSPSTSNELSSRLQTATRSLQRMAKLLERTMHSAQPTFGILHESETLEQCMATIVQGLAPLAEDLGVSVTMEITPAAAVLPVESLGTVILNGVRNAIQACSRSTTSQRRVEISAVINAYNELLILISDTGPGAPAEHDCLTSTSSSSSHGIGLELSRRVVQQFGGDLRLMNIPFGCGAVLQVIIPVRRLMQHG